MVVRSPKITPKASSGWETTSNSRFGGRGGGREATAVEQIIRHSDVSSPLADRPVSPRLPEELLALRGVTKRFGGAVALDGVDFDLRAGEIHGLLGENGAGKSTLMKILSGVHVPDEGDLMLRGEPVRFGSPADAKARGIGMIYQELSTIGALSVAENVFLGDQLRNRVGLVDWKRMHAEATAMLRELGIDIDVTERLGLLPLGAQQLVEIARVVFSGAEVVILDEPTSALSEPEATRLFEFMLELKGRGKSLIFISHFLEDVLAVADRVTILKNARKLATLPNDGLTKHHLINLMIGADATALAAGYEAGVTLPTPTTTAPVLEIEELSAGKDFDDVSLTVRSGQIAKRLGIAYLTENRRATLFPRHEVFKNITLAHLEHLVRPIFRQSSELAVAAPLVTRTGVRPPNARLLAGHLSGGNQQKVVLAKWLTRTPKLLILNEPTRGMDVGAKREVLDLIKALATQGVAILLLSTEPETVLAGSNRIVVMSKGRITKEFAGEAVSKEQLMSYAW